jgi:hypothetical protein
MSKLQKKPSDLERDHPTLQNMNLKKKILLFRVIFALLDPDLDSESGSGSTDPIESRSHPDTDPDPDPQPFINAFLLYRVHTKPPVFREGTLVPSFV